MLDILLYISNFLIVFGFLGYIIVILIYKKYKNSEYNGFNITKDVLNEFDSINIIENKSYFTVYNIRRKVIKIASNCYYGNSVSDMAISLMEAGISVVDNNKNNFILFMKKIVSNLKYLYILPIIAVIFNSISSGILDFKIGILLTAIFSIIMYFLINIKSEGIIIISKELEKNKKVNNDLIIRIISFMNKVILLDKLIFISELVMIIRFIAIILNFS